MTCSVRSTPAAARMLAAITDRRIREQIAKRIDGLAHNPELQGKPLIGELSGLRSLRAAGQRYRIIYTVNRRIVTVIILAVGVREEGDRRDIYELAKKLIRMGLLAT